MDNKNVKMDFQDKHSEMDDLRAQLAALMNKVSSLETQLASAKKHNDYASNCIQKTVETPEECYQKGVILFDNREFEKAVEYFQKAADRGLAIAQNKLGECYENGKGVEKNYEEAFKWYQKAADQNHADAQGNLAALYANGWGVEQNFSKSLTLAQKSSTKGVLRAKRLIAVAYLVGNRGIEEDSDKGIKLMLDLAEHGYRTAQYDLYQIYSYGHPGVEKNPEEGLKWLVLSIIGSDMLRMKPIPVTTDR